MDDGDESLASSVRCIQRLIADTHDKCEAMVS